MFPFQWPNIFISVFPAPLVDFLQAFVPFLFGMSTRTYEKFVRDGAVPDEVLLFFFFVEGIRWADLFILFFFWLLYFHLADLCH